MLLRRIGLVVAIPIALIATLSGADSSPPTVREKRHERPATAPLSAVVLETGFGEALIAQEAEWHAQAAREEADRVAAAEAARRLSAPPSVAAHSDAWWDAIAQCETGSDFTMHGSIYSSAYGIINAAIHQNASPDSAARILSGTASKAEQLAVAKAVWAYAGDRAWGCSPFAWQRVPSG